MPMILLKQQFAFVYPYHQEIQINKIKWCNI